MHACRSTLEDPTNRTQELTLEWRDLELVADGQMVLAVQLNARAAGSWLSGVLANAASDAVERDADGERLGADAEARFLLDVLDASLRDQQATLELADAVLMARADADGALESSLRARLAVDDEGPLRGIDALAERTADAIENLSLRASARIDAQAEQYELSTWTSRLIANDAQGEQVASLDLSQASAASAGHATRPPGEDVLIADSLRMKVAFGALAVEVVREVTEGAEAKGLFGCSTLEEWLEGQAIDDVDSCDDDCFDAVCERVRLRLLASAEPALLAVDVTRPEIELSGTLELSDTNGDLQVDVIEAAELSGAWLAASDGGSSAALFGSAKATALAVAE